MADFQHVPTSPNFANTKLLLNNWRIFWVIRNPEWGYFIQYRKTKSTPWSSEEPMPTSTRIVGQADTLEEVVILLARMLEEGLDLAKEKEKESN